MALTDLDTVAEMALPTLPDWACAHRVHAQLVGAWLASDVDVVVDEGTSTTDEVQQVLAAVPAGIKVFHVVLTADYHRSLARAQADPGRGLSKDPDFLRAAHLSFAQHLPNAAVQFAAGRREACTESYGRPSPRAPLKTRPRLGTPPTLNTAGPLRQ